MSNNILIIEDDEDISRNLKHLLESEGYNVFTAQNGRVALENLSKMACLPSLIILDLMMPIMDGYSFREAQETDSRLSTIPVVVMSADSQIEYKKIKLGAKYYLRKPLDIDNVLDVVQSHIIKDKQIV